MVTFLKRLPWSLLFWLGSCAEAPAVETGARSSMGYVWANEPLAASYTPHRDFAYNSSGGAINISRPSTGAYIVRFAGLGGQGAGGGTVQVTAYGSGSATCKVLSWESEAGDFVVDARCFESSGALADSQYTVLALWPFSASRGDTFSRRTIHADGTVEIQLADGTVKRRSRTGTWTITDPSGNSSAQAALEVPELTPPSTAPYREERAWLSQLSERLLGIIQGLVGDESLANYLRSYEDECVLPASKRDLACSRG